MCRRFAFLVFFFLAAALPCHMWPAATAAPAGSTVVDVSDFSFAPEVVMIKAGGTVRWENRSGVHNVVAYAGGIDFDSGSPTGGNWTFEVTFDRPGVYLYLCEPHSSFMRGTIVVEERYELFLPAVISP